VAASLTDLPDWERAMDYADVCRIAGEYFIAGLAKYGLAPGPVRVRAAEPAQAAIFARGGGALLLASPCGRMGLWLSCLDAAGSPCLLPGEGGVC